MKLRTVRDPEEMQDLAIRLRTAGQRIVFVPTMGDLHDGHLELIRRAARWGNRIVVSIFVNPKQFGPREDLAGYPRNERRDRRRAASAGAHVLYVPPATAMYPTGFKTRVVVDELSGRLCGVTRPDHFSGVVTVLVKLLHQVGAQVMVMGQKDAQQALIVRRMLIDLDLARQVELRVCPTVREPDGLAMSSRNRYLTRAERRQAPVLYAALRAGVDRIARGERRTSAVRRSIRSVLHRAQLVRPEYVRLVDTESLLEHDRLPSEVLIALAVRLGRARLIDNVVVRLAGGRAKRARGHRARRVEEA